MGDWPWHATGEELESHGAQGKIIQCALRFPEEPDVKGTVVGAIRRVRTPKDGSGGKWIHLHILGFGTRDVQRLMQSRFQDEDSQDRLLIHLCGDPENCSRRMKGTEFGMSADGGKPVIMHAKKWRYLSGEEAARMKHPGAGLKAYDGDVENLQALWDARHPDSRAMGSPARGTRGKGKGEEDDGGDDEEDDEEGDDEEEESGSDDKEDYEDESGEGEDGEAESEYEAKEEEEDDGEGDVPPPPAMKTVSLGKELVELHPKKATKPEKGSGGVEHSKKGESEEMEKELRIMKRRAEADVEEGEAEKKKKKVEKSKDKKKEKDKGGRGDGEKEKGKEADEKKETAAEVKEQEFGKVREAVNKSVVSSITRLKKKKKGALTKVKKALGISKKKDTDDGSEEDEEDESDDEEEGDFGEGSSGIEVETKKVRLHKRIPGVISRRGLWRMHESVRAVSGGRPERNKKKMNEETPSAAVAYLNLCFLRKAGNQEKPPPKGKVREMETLAHVIDAAAEGDVGGAMDIAIARFQALEVSHEDGGWGTAEHIEVAPRLEFSATSQGERQAAAKIEEAKQKREKLIVRTTAGGTDGGSPGGGLGSPGRRKSPFVFQYRPAWARWQGAKGRGGQGGGWKGRGRGLARKGGK